MYNRRGPPPPLSRGPSYRTRQERQPPPSSILGPPPPPPPQASHVSRPLYPYDGGDRALSQQQDILSSEAAGQILAHALLAEALVVGHSQPVSHHHPPPPPLPPPIHRYNSVDDHYHSSTGEWHHSNERQIPPMPPVGSDSLLNQPHPLFHSTYEPNVRTESFLPANQDALISREQPGGRSHGNLQNKVSIFDRPINRSYDIAPPLHDHGFVTDNSSSRTERLTSSRSTRSRASDRDRGYSESYQDKVSRVTKETRDVSSSSSKHTSSSSRSGDRKSRKYSGDDRRSDRLEDRESRGRSPKRRRPTDSNNPSISHSRPKSREGGALPLLTDKQERLLEVRQDHVEVSLSSRSPVEARLGPPPALTDRLGPAPDISVQSRLGPVVPLIPELPDLREQIEEKRRFEGHSRPTSISPTVEFQSSSVGTLSTLQSDIKHRIDSPTQPSAITPTSHVTPAIKLPIQTPPLKRITPPLSLNSSKQIDTTVYRSSSQREENITPTVTPLIPVLPDPQLSIPPLLSVVPPTPLLPQPTSLPFSNQLQQPSSSRLQVVETSKPDVYIVSDDDTQLVIDTSPSEKNQSTNSMSPKDKLVVITSQITKLTPPHNTTTSTAGLLTSKPSQSVVVSSSPVSKVSSVQLRSFSIPALEKMSPTSSFRSVTPSSTLSDSQSSLDQGSSSTTTLKTPKRANTILGNSLVFLLDSSTPSDSPTILARFFDAVITIHRLCKLKIGRVCAFKYFVPYFQDTFKGFVTGTLLERPLKPTTLYERELTHLLTICKNDVVKWKQQLNTFNLLAQALPQGKSSIESFLVRHNLMQPGEVGSPNKKTSGVVFSSTRTTVKSKTVAIPKTDDEDSNIESIKDSSRQPSSKSSKSSDLLQQSNRIDLTVDKDSPCTSSSNKPLTETQSSAKPSQSPSKSTSVKPLETTDEPLKEDAVMNTTNQIDVSISTQSSNSIGKPESQCVSTQDKTTSKTNGKKTTENATVSRAEKLAKRILTRALVSELNQLQEISLLKELFDSTVKIYGCIKWKKGNNFCWKYFIPYFQNVYQGFAVGELTDSTIPSTPKILFHKELRNLLSTCGSDVKKWQQRIKAYVSTTANLPKNKQNLSKFLQDNHHLISRGRSSSMLFSPSHSSYTATTATPLTKETDVQVNMFIPLSSEEQPNESRVKTPVNKPSTSVVMQSPTPTQHRYSHTPTIRSPLPSAKLNVHEESAFSFVVKPSQVEVTNDTKQDCRAQKSPENDNTLLLRKNTVSTPATSSQENEPVYSQQLNDFKRTHSQHLDDSETIDSVSPQQIQPTKALMLKLPFTEEVCIEKDEPITRDESTRNTPTHFMVIDSYDSQETDNDSTTAEADDSHDVNTMKNTGNEVIKTITHPSSISTEFENIGSELKLPIVSVSLIKDHDTVTTIDNVNPSNSTQYQLTEEQEDQRSLSPGEIVSPCPPHQHKHDGSLSPGEIVSPSLSNQGIKPADNASISSGEIISSSSSSASPTLAQKVAAKNIFAERDDSQPPLGYSDYMYHSSYMLHGGRSYSPPVRWRSAGQWSQLRYLHRSSRKPSRYRERSRDRRSRSHDRRSRSRDRRSRSRDRKSRSRDKRSRSHDRRSRSHDRRSRSRDRRSRSRDKRSRSHNRRSRSHDRRSRSHDRVSRSHDRRSRSHGRQSKSRDRRSGSVDKTSSRSFDRSSVSHRGSKSRERKRDKRSRSHDSKLTSQSQDTQENKHKMRLPSSSSTSSSISNSPCNSEESELEILELKKKAIMSMIKKGRTPSQPVQNNATSTKPSVSVGDDGANVATSDKNDSLYPLITAADLVSGTGEGGVIDMDICSTSSVDSSYKNNSPSTIERGVSIDQCKASVEESIEEQSLLSDAKCHVALTDSEDGKTDGKTEVKVQLVVSKENVDSEVSNSLDGSSKSPELKQVSVSSRVVKLSSSLSARDVKASQSTLSPAVSPPSSIPSPPGQCLISRPGLKNGNQAALQSVKIYPSKKETWDIQPFHIVSSGVDSDSDDNDGNDNQPISDISKFLLDARKAADVSAKSVPKDGTSPHQLLELPSPIAALPAAKRQEYIILQKQLALHKKKKAKVRSNSSPQIQATKKETSNSSSSLQVTARVGIVNTSRKRSRSPNNTTSPPSSSKKPCIEDIQSVKQPMETTSTCEARVNEHRRIVECGQQKLTSLTEQLTVTVSEIEELELKMELYTKHIARLKKQLEVTREQHSKAEEKRQSLQNEVRTIQETMTQHNQYIQEAESRDGALGVVSHSHGYSPLQYENISDSESAVSTSGNPQLQGHQLQQPLLKTIDYENISNVSSPAPNDSPQHNQQPSNDGTHQLISLEPSSLNVEPISDAEDTVSRHPSPVIVELVSDCEQASVEDLPTGNEAVTGKECSFRGGARVDNINIEHNYTNRSLDYSPPLVETRQADQGHESCLSVMFPEVKEHNYCSRHSPHYEVEIPTLVNSEYPQSMLSQVNVGKSLDLNLLEPVKSTLPTTQDVDQANLRSHDTSQDISLQSHPNDDESHDTSSKSHDLPEDASKASNTVLESSSVTTKKKKKSKHSFTCRRTEPYNHHRSSSSTFKDKSKKAVKKTSKKTVSKECANPQFSLELLDQVLHTTLSTTLHSMVTQHSCSPEHTSTSSSTTVVSPCVHTDRVEDILSALVTSLNQTNVSTPVSSSIPSSLSESSLPQSPVDTSPQTETSAGSPMIPDPSNIWFDTLDNSGSMVDHKEQEELDYMHVDPSVIFHPGTDDLFNLSSSVAPLFKRLPRQEWAHDLPLEIDHRAFDNCVMDSVRAGLVFTSAQKSDNDSSQSSTLVPQQQQLQEMDSSEKDNSTSSLRKSSSTTTTTHQQVTNTVASSSSTTGKPVKSNSEIKTVHKQTDDALLASKIPSVKPLPIGSSGSSNITAAKIQVVQDQLQRKIKELKGQLAAKSSTSGRSSPVESSTLVPGANKSIKTQPSSQMKNKKTASSGIKRSTPMLATSIKSKADGSSSLVVKTTEAVDVTKEICKLLGGDNIAQLDQLQKLYETRESKTFGSHCIKMGEQRLDLLSLTFCCVGPLNMYTESVPTVNDDIIRAIEQTTPEITSSVPKPTGHYYTSPLLAFKSYRLNPLYRTHEKLSLSSLSHSNKIDPHKILCKFELFGVCNNPECNAQHLRDVQLSKEEVVKDLVSYSPSLAGCSENDVAMMEQYQSPELQNRISEKLSTFASSLVQRYSSKVPNEDLYKVAVHEVNSEKSRTAKKGYVNFQDLQSSASVRREEQSVSHSSNISYLDTQFTGAGVVGSGPNNKPIIQRYFTLSEDVTTSSDPVQQCIHAAQQTSGEEMVSILKTGLEQAPSSQELWIEYIRCNVATETTFDEDPCNSTLSELCHKAIQATNCSQAVVFECVKALGTYKEKQRVLNEAVKILRRCPLTNTTSLQCLELVLNSVLLDVISGKAQTAVKRLQLAFTTQDGEQENPFDDLASSLIHNHRLILSLCYINIVYTDQLPHSVFPMEDSFPARMISLNTFTIDWDKHRQLTHNDYKRMLKIFRVCLECCALTGNETEDNDDQSSSDDIKQCLSLYLNLLLFQATHGDTQKAIKLLTKITTISPQLTEPWILYARVLKDKEAILKVLTQATQHCPTSSELYYLAARSELSCDRGKEEERDVQKAIKWLTLCVTKFYKMSTSPPLPQPMDTLYLYRKLLGLMVPYEYQAPEYADNVNLDLTKQSVTLWLCYCLMVELQQLITPDHQEAASLVLQTREVGSEFYHDSVEEAFETAIHSIYSPDGSVQLWREYLLYTRAKLTNNDITMFKHLYNLVQRCLVAMKSSQTYLIPLYGQPDNCQDYSYHNEISDLFLSILPPSSPLELAVLQRFIKLLPANSTLLARLVLCAVNQSKVELAQTLLANYLLEHPHSCLLWRMAVGVERRLKHPREARWLYRQALKNLPLHFELWKDLLLFEVDECISNKGVSLTGSLVSRVMRGAQHRDIDLNLKIILP